MRRLVWPRSRVLVWDWEGWKEDGEAPGVVDCWAGGYLPQGAADGCLAVGKCTPSIDTVQYRFAINLLIYLYV